MSRLVFCSKLQEEAEGLNSPPLPGELGLKIYQQISKKAWSQWLSQQTMLINEYRLNLMDSNSRDFLRKEMENFLFKNLDVMPPGFVQEKK